MKPRASATAQRLVNLYRSSFVIDGRWAAVNKVFMDEADDAVLAEIVKLPGGKYLEQHISNLKSKKTPMDSIDADLLPYNGAMTPMSNAKIDDATIKQLRSAIENFQPDAEHVRYIKSLPIVQSFGEHWANGVASILNDDSLASIWRGVVQSDKALRLWARAGEILESTPNDLLRAEIQADLPEYETYLPMFGADGLNVIQRLRNFVA